MNAGQRVFSPAPDAVLDPASGRPRFGSYVGAVPRIDLGEVSALNRIARHKRWVYVAVAAEDAFVALAIVRFGYAATVFGYALDAGTMRMLEIGCDYCGKQYQMAPEQLRGLLEAQ